MHCMIVWIEMAVSWGKKIIGNGMIDMNLKMNWTEPNWTELGYVGTATDR